MIERFFKNDIFILLSFLCILSFLYLYDISTELYGDDDYIHPLIGARLYYYIKDIFSFETSLINKINSFFSFLYFTLFTRHGFAQDWFMALNYGIMDILNIKINNISLHFPMALFASITITLLFVILRLYKICKSTSITICLFIAFSPVFFASARGLGSYWVTGIVFHYALAMLSFIYFRKQNYLLTSIFLIIIVTSDQLFYLLLLSFFCPFLILRIVNFDLKKRKIKIIDLSNVFKNLHFNSRQIKFIKTILALFFIYFAIQFLLHFSLKNVSEIHNYIHYLEPFKNRIDMVSLNFFSYEILKEKFYHAFGFIGLFLFIIKILIIFINIKKVFKLESEFKKIIILFSLLSSIGFFLIFYILVPAGGPVSKLFQIYFICPFLITLFLLIDLFSNNIRKFLKLVSIPLIVFSLISANINYVWKKPFILKLNSLMSFDSWGLKYKDIGTKATGYIIREKLSSLYNNNKYENIIIEYKINKNFKTSFLVYSGLIKENYWYKSKYDKFNNIKVIFNKNMSCDVNICVSINSEDKELKNLIITSSNEHIANINFNNKSNFVKLKKNDLEKKYDTNFYKIKDFYVPSSNEKIATFLQRLF